MSDYKEIDVVQEDNVAKPYGNLEQRELDTEPQNKPLGKKPALNPNPGYGSNINQNLLEAAKEFDKKYVDGLFASFPNLKVHIVGTWENPDTHKKVIEDHVFELNDIDEGYIAFGYQTDGGAVYVYANFVKGTEAPYGITFLGIGYDDEIPLTLSTFEIIQEADTTPEAYEIFKNVGKYTRPAIKTQFVEGERGTPTNVVNSPKDRVIVRDEVYNFLKGILIKGKPIEEYIDLQGGVTEAELQAAVAELNTKLGTKSTVWFFEEGASWGPEANKVQSGDIIVVNNLAYLVGVANVRSGDFTFHRILGETSRIVDGSVVVYQLKFSSELSEQTLTISSKTIPDATVISNIHRGTIIGDETKFDSTYKVGDIIIDTTGFVGVVKSISFSNNALASCTILGIRNNNIPTTHIYDGSDWTNTDLGDATFTGNVEISKDSEDPDNTGNLEVENKITAKTLEQSQANWSQNISSIIFGGINSNLVVDIGYSAFKVVNASLKFIIEFKISNPTESNINLLSANTNNLGNIPDEIASKLYLVNGSSLKDNTESNVLLTQFPILIAPNGSFASTPQIGSAMLYATNNQLMFGFRFYNNQGIAANSYATLSSRVELDLI